MVSNMIVLCVMALFAVLPSGGYGEREVKPLIPLNGVFEGFKGASGRRVISPPTGPAPGPGPAPEPAPRPSPPGEIPPENRGAGGGKPPPGVPAREGKAWTDTSGKRIQCATHVDCYGYREANEWCPLPPGVSYGDRGCWCDKTIGMCVIDRIEGPSGTQWSFCHDKATSRCSVPPKD